MIIVDVETTGIYYNKHSIVSIGALDLLNPDNHFYIENKIRYGAEIDFDALEQNGFTREQITDASKPSLENAIIEFFEWVDGAKLGIMAGILPGFDHDFIRNSAERYSIALPFTYYTVDLYSAVVIDTLRSNKLPPLNLDAPEKNNVFIMDYVGIPDEPTPHDALIGAKYVAEAFSRLIYGKNLLNEFKEHPIPDYLKNIS